MWGTGCASSLGRICVRVTLQISLRPFLKNRAVNYNVYLKNNFFGHHKHN